MWGAGLETKENERIVYCSCLVLNLALSHYFSLTILAICTIEGKNMDSVRNNRQRDEIYGLCLDCASHCIYLCYR